MLTIDEVTKVWYLAFTVWREARGEDAATQAAVAYSILNRVANPRWWGHSIDEVVTKPWQYSSLTDHHDPQLAEAWPHTNNPSWLKTFGIVQRVMEGVEPNPTPDADSYHDDSISPPWTQNPKIKFIGKVGRILFFDTKLA